MDRGSCDLVEMSRVAFEDFIRQPTKKDQRANRGCEAEQE